MVDLTKYHTDTVLGLIRDVREKQDFSALPILADALQDADFPEGLAVENDATISNKPILTLLREANDPVQMGRLLCLILGGEYWDAVVWMDGFAAELGDSWGYDDGFDEKNPPTQPTQPMNYRVLMEGAFAHLSDGDYLTQLGSEHWRATLWSQVERFWDHFEVVTGRSVEDKQASFLSCSC